MQSKLTPLAAVAAAATLALGACDSGSDDAANAQANAARNAPPVELKMIQASHVYRCKDNSLLYVDFYTNNTAAARPGKDAAPVELTAANGQPPYTAEGWSISANAPEITLTAPGKGTQTCRTG